MYFPLQVSHLTYSWRVLRGGHSLLGWSAFAGFLVLALGWPLNSFIAKRSIRIQKGVMAARDKRMGVLNELIGAVCHFLHASWANIDRRNQRSNSSNSSHGRIVGSTV
jgi:hypothetical protein